MGNFPLFPAPARFFPSVQSRRCCRRPLRRKRAAALKRDANEPLVRFNAAGDFALVRWFVWVSLNGKRRLLVLRQMCFASNVFLEASSSHFRGSPKGKHSSRVFAQVISASGKAVVPASVS